MLHPIHHSESMAFIQTAVLCVSYGMHSATFVALCFRLWQYALSDVRSDDSSYVDELNLLACFMIMMICMNAVITAVIVGCRRSASGS